MAQPLIETFKPGPSYWLAYDESLNPHKFRVIKYRAISSTYYATEYGTVSTRNEGNIKIACITPKHRKSTTIIFNDDEEVSEQDLLSLLVYWTAKPLFLAVPAPVSNQEQNSQETLF